jgi:hypothetical protein
VGIKLKSEVVMKTVKELKSEMLNFFCETDLELYEEITESTKEAYRVQCEEIPRNHLELNLLLDAANKEQHGKIIMAYIKKLKQELKY